MSTSTETTPLDPQIAAVAAEIEAAPLTTPEEAEAFRIRFLGRKSGAITDLFGRMGEAPPEQRRALGQRLNALKARAQARLDEAEAARAAAPATAATDLDLTLPGRVPPPLEPGALHPLTQTLHAIEQIFQGFGFSVARGPEIETDWHNFTALNFPPEHPARDMQDTFFLEPPPPEGRGVVLRTHTSPVQIRVMEAGVRDRTGPPFRVIAPGRVFRNEAISYKSFCLFHQVEGLVVDEGVTFADLRAMLHAFARAFYGAGVRMRFRPSYFPFTEPSAEVDIWWADARLPDGGRWLEILGCGMVDPAVLENVGIDPERYTGYAFGMGVERQAMLRHDVPDIRLLYENDVRFLRQF
ncbi:MAG TPA: phenylalanine--tRNA ligase subunit alpha [Rubricoccaceae bacterium]|nr:phenylalanine--tRNA ligase subunit alpha [Rubricoccaceae bacterium]